MKYLAVADSCDETSSVVVVVIVVLGVVVVGCLVRVVVILFRVVVRLLDEVRQHTCEPSRHRWLPQEEVRAASPRTARDRVWWGGVWPSVRTRACRSQPLGDRLLGEVFLLARQRHHLGRESARAVELDHTGHWRLLAVFGERVDGRRGVRRRVRGTDRVA
eukprot:4934071-Prymnesium_polylepis.2